MYKENILKKLNFENGNYCLSYCLRPIACIKVAKKPLSEEIKNNLILKFKKNLIGESKTKLFFNFSASKQIREELNDFDEVKDKIDKLISERKTFYVNRFKDELCVDTMYFEKGKRILWKI